jgi:hypothetical protein
MILFRNVLKVKNFIPVKIEFKIKFILEEKLEFVILIKE